MAIDYPNSPTSGQIHTVGDKSWIWDGATWKAYGASLSPSVLKVDATNARVGINNQSPAYALDVNGTIEGTQFLQGTDYLSPYQGFRNKIINGSFEFWQRGTARTFLQAGQYLADRWTVRLYQNNAHQRTAVTPVAGMQTRYALRSNSSTTAENAGGTRMWANTMLESADSIPLRGKTMTFSFWVRFSSATCSSSTATAYGNWDAYIDWFTSTTDAPIASTGADGGAGSITLTNGSLPTTWTKYTGTATIPSNANNVGLQFGFAGLGNTASAGTVWYEITQVQLEEGSVATPFEQRPYATELALCQRYFQLINSYMSTGDFAIPMIRESATQGQSTIFLPVSMRVLPSLYGATYGRCVLRDTAFNVIAAGVSSIALNSSGPSFNAITLVIVHGSVTGTYVFCEWDMLGTWVSLGLSAEL
jgi:hypothetical protein